MTWRPLAALVAIVTLARPAVAQEPSVQLDTRGVSGNITANGGAVVMSNAGSMASLLIQTTGTFNLTWELECAADPAGTAFDTDDEIPVTLVSSSPTPADTVATNVAGLYTANIAGCTAVQVIATAYTSGTMGVTLSAISSGGGSGGGGGSASSVSITQGGNTAAVNASSQLSVTCANCSGSGVSVNEDVASADGQAGTPAYTVRNDTVTGATSTDGDYQPMKSDAAGRTYVTGTGGTFPVSGVAAADAPVSGNPVLLAGRGSTATPTAMSADGDVTQIWTDLNGRVRTDLSTIAGTAAVNGSGTATGALRVELPTNGTGVIATVGTVTAVTTLTGTTTLTPGTGAANLGKAEDAVHASGDTGVMDLTVRTDTAAPLAGTTGDYQPFITDALGKLWTTGSFAEDAAHTSTDTGGFVLAIRRDTTPTSSSGTAGDYSAFNVDANGRLYTNTTLYNSSGTELTPATDVAHDAAANSTGPQIMGEATSGLTSDTAVADGDATRLKTDLLGRQITVPGCGTNDRVRGYLANTDGASTSVLAAQGAGIIAEIWTVIIANSSATDVTVDLRDGTAGSVLTTLMAPATTDTGGGGVYNLNSPLLFTANTAVAADASAAATTLYITVLGCKVK